MTDPLLQGGEPLTGGAGLGMGLPKHLFANGESALVEREGLLAVSLPLLK